MSISNGQTQCKGHSLVFRGDATVPPAGEGSRQVQLRHTQFAQTEFCERLKRRDITALAEIVEAYLPQILRAGRGMGFSPADNEDLAQETFAALFEGIDRFEGRSHIRTFLFGIFYHKVSERLRELMRTRQYDPIDEVMEAKFSDEGNWRQSPVDIEKQLYAKEVCQMISKSLNELPRVHRIVFYLREVEEMGTDEICKQMEISRTNCGVLLFRARNRLRELLVATGVRSMRQSQTS